MSKGNVVLGYGRGAIGDMVLTRLKGQQVAKARNRQPANPRTAPQMRQRAGFIAPLKFYTRGIQNLFQFAFTDKRLKESDYNAFMRINVGSGFPLTPSEFQQNAFPALGNWVMSRGPLVAPTVVVDAEHSNSIGIRVSGLQLSSKISLLSQYLINTFNLQEGDIVTFVSIVANNVKTTASQITFGEDAEVSWFIDQFKIDSNDDRTIDSVLYVVHPFTVSGNSYLGLNATDYPVTSFTVGMTCIVSRRSSKRFLVSTSRLVNGGYVNDYIAFRNTPAEIQRVLAEWGATSTAILKGGLL